MLIDHYKRIIYVQRLVLDLFVLDLKLVLAFIGACIAMLYPVRT